MGTRIHKVMGYGLADLADTDRDRSRFDQRLARHPLDLFERLDGPLSRDGFLAWLEARAAAPAADGGRDGSRLDMLLTRKMVEMDPDWRPYQGFDWSFEGSDPAVLILVPVGFHRQWVRHNDGLDYAEHKADHGACTAPILRRLATGIHPYTDRVWDVRDGRALPDLELLSLAQLGDDATGPQTVRQLTGLASPAEVRAFARPAVPPAIRLFCEWAEVFADAATVRSLQPLLHTYWR